MVLIFVQQGWNLFGANQANLKTSYHCNLRSAPVLASFTLSKTKAFYYSAKLFLAQNPTFLGAELVIGFCAALPPLPGFFLPASFHPGSRALEASVEGGGGGPLRKLDWNIGVAVQHIQGNGNTPIVDGELAWQSFRSVSLSITHRCCCALLMDLPKCCDKFYNTHACTSTSRSVWENLSHLCNSMRVCHAVCLSVCRCVSVHKSSICVDVFVCPCVSKIPAG